MNRIQTAKYLDLVDCPECQGRKSYVCDECQGFGELEEAMCYHMNSNCPCTRRVYKCNAKDCDNGDVPCTFCEGRGKVYYWDKQDQYFVTADEARELGVHF